MVWFGAEVLRFLPAARGQVEDGGGSHVGGLGIMGVIIGRVLPVAVDGEAGGRRLREGGLT